MHAPFALAPLLLPGVRAWLVEETNPFQYDFTVSLVRDRVHTCTGALYRHSIALVPSICVQGPQDRTRVEMFRHNLSMSVTEEARSMPLWSPHSEIPLEDYYARAPASAAIKRVYFLKELAVLHLDTAAGADLTLHRYSDPQRMRLVGWGEGPVPLKTRLPFALTKGCQAISPRTPLKRQLCVKEPFLEKRGAEFRRGALLINYASARPNLLGLMVAQYRTGDGCYVASLVRIESHVASIAAVLRHLHHLP